MRRSWGGSSPLTRGKRGRREPTRWVQRIIPAHAGKTPRALPDLQAAGDHPRSRGENARRARKHVNFTGSSPLTRGKQLCEGGRAGCVGIIPAHAGKTTDGARTLVRSWDHPRSRGENGYLSAFRVTGLGSSPLTRGKHIDRTCRQRQVGIIPAHAGKTHSGFAECSPNWDHPRSRGENCRGGRGA